MLSLQLPDDGAHAAIKHTYHGVEAMALLLQAGQGDAVFGLELGIGGRMRQHDGTLQGRVLHFRFESAKIIRCNSIVDFYDAQGQNIFAKFKKLPILDWHF